MPRTQRQLSLILLTFCLLAQRARAADLCVIMPLEPFDVDAGKSQVLTGILSAELSKSGRFELVPEASVKAVVSGKKDDYCKDMQCAIDLGKLLQTAYVVYGSVGRLEQQYVVTVFLASVKEEKLVANASENAQSLDGLVPAIKRIAHTISGKNAQEPAGPRETPSRAGAAKSEPMAKGEPSPKPESEAKSSIRPWLYAGGGALLLGGGAAALAGGGGGGGSDSAAVPDTGSAKNDSPSGGLSGTYGGSATWTFTRSDGSSETYTRNITVSVSGSSVTITDTTPGGSASGTLSGDSFAASKSWTRGDQTGSRRFTGRISGRTASGTLSGEFSSPTERGTDRGSFSASK